MHIAHIEARPVPAEPARPQRREPPLVGQLGQRIGLIHELAQLVAAEELADCSLHRADVDQRAGSGLIRIDDRHPLPHHPLHPHHPDPELVLQLLADRADAAVAEMVDVVGHRAPVVDRHLGVDDRQQVAQPERAVARLIGAAALRIQLQPPGPFGQLAVHLAQPLAHLVAAHAAQVVAARVEELPVQQRAGRLRRGRIAGPQLLVQLVHRPLFVALRPVARARLLLQRRGHELVHLVVRVGTLQHRQNPLVGAQPWIDLGPLTAALRAVRRIAQIGVVQRTQQRRHGNLALAVHLHREQIAVARLELQPGPAARNQLRRAERAPRRRIRVGPEIDARRAHQLGDHDALRAVDDERARLRHVRQVAEEQLLLLGLVGLLAQQADRHTQLARVVEVALAALVRRLVRRDVAVVLEIQLHPVAGEIGDRRHLAEQLGQPHIQEPLVGVAQQLDQVGQLVRFRQARVVDRLRRRRRRGENHGVLLLADPAG